MGNVVENLCKYTGALLGIRAGFAATLPLYDDGCGGSAGPDAPGGGLSRRNIVEEKKTEMSSTLKINSIAESSFCAVTVNVFLGVPKKCRTRSASCIKHV